MTGNSDISNNREILLHQQVLSKLSLNEIKLRLHPERGNFEPATNVPICECPLVPRAMKRLAGSCPIPPRTIWKTELDKKCRKLYKKTYVHFYAINILYITHSLRCIFVIQFLKGQ